MSINAIHWALNDRHDLSNLAIVLVGLASHADPNSRNAFPALAGLTCQRRLPKRSARCPLRTLEELDLIRLLDPKTFAAYMKRADRRPNGYSLSLHRGEVAENNSVELEEQTPSPRGVKLVSETSLNIKETISSPLGGQCDVRSGDRVPSRLVRLYADRPRSVLRPRCHAAGGAR